MAGGRRPLDRGVLPFDTPDAPLPPVVVLDTSFVIDALIPTQPLHRVCADYLKRLQSAQTAVAFNRLLELEVPEAAYKIALKERFGRNFLRMRGDGRALRRAGRLADELERSWRDVLDTFRWAVVEVADVVDEVPGLMRRGLGSYDSAHAATAIVAGIEHLVTLDTGFGRADQADLTVLTDSSRLPGLPSPPRPEHLETFFTWSRACGAGGA